MVAELAAGSVIVDLAVEAGGNVEGSRPEETVLTPNGVKIIGPANMPSRIAADASQLYARNLLSFLALLVKDKELKIDTADEIIKATLLTENGAVVNPLLGLAGRGGSGSLELTETMRWQTPPLWPTAPASSPTRPARSRAISTLLTHQLTTVQTTPAVVGGPSFVFELTVFVLAVFVGYYVVWRVTPALHSPLMSVTNAISSVIIVGALIAAGPLGVSFAKIMGFVAVTLAAVNIFGGFIVTQRMLQMFQKKR